MNKLFPLLFPLALLSSCCKEPPVQPVQPPVEDPIGCDNDDIRYALALSDLDLFNAAVYKKTHTWEDGRTVNVTGSCYIDPNRAYAYPFGVYGGHFSDDPYAFGPDAGHFATASEATAALRLQLKKCKCHL